ncbi:MarR family winged helix-turn-helix transcriptional regulator [Halobacillus seohaensis]|uniref:MarR family winged helix-turn-helix transcriptional regulator n=1 Tax=Halobacillus seohaensis TaxID=447421 RepID=A0ABW2ESJ7_9BACI
MNKRLDLAVDLFKEVMIYGTERVIKSIDHEIFHTYSPEQLQMLQIISKEDVSPGRLAAMQGVHKSAVSNRVKKLSSKGLVEIAGSESDQRGKTIKLTNKGKELIQQSNEVVYQYIENILQDGLEDSEIEEFIRIFHKLRNILKVEEGYE